MHAVILDADLGKWFGINVGETETTEEEDQLKRETTTIRQAYYGEEKQEANGFTINSRLLQEEDGWWLYVKKEPLNEH